MKRTNQVALLGVAVLVFMLAACNKDDAAYPIPAVTKSDTLLVKFSNSSTFAFYSFKNGKLVANADSATTKWDFGLRRTTFILNSYAYGPGNAAAQLSNQLYSDILSAPETGYAYDTTTSQKAIKDGSWYNYDPITHSFSPKAGQTFIFRTADNFYVKMELTAVDYEPFVGPSPTNLVYRFRYTYQGNGTKVF